MKSLRIASVLGCFALAGCTPVAPAGTSPREAHEIAIYRVVRDTLWRGHQLRVIDSTLVTPAFASIAEHLRGDHAVLRGPLMEALSRRRDLRAILAAVPFRPISRAAVDSVFDAGVKGWPAFYAKYGQGYADLAPVVMDEAESLAAVYVEMNCGDLCGSGNLVSLVRSADGLWRVTSISNVWVS